MAHVRRKFENSLEYNRDVSETALNKIGRWFELEREAKDKNLTFEHRSLMRQDLMQDEFDSFKRWAMEQVPNHLPKSPLRKAFEYAYVKEKFSIS